METLTFTVPGLAFAGALSRLRDELIGVAAGVDPFPLPRLFDYIALTPNNQGLQRKIAERGRFMPAAGGTYVNEGRIISEPVHDVGAEFERVRLYVPKLVTVRPSYDGSVLAFDLTASRILLTFSEPPAPGFADRFVVESLVVREDRWTYLAVGDPKREHAIEVVVDLQKAPQSFRPVRSDFPGWDRAGALLRARPRARGGGCSCCGTDNVINPPPPPPGPRTVVLHAKVIWSAQPYAVDQLVSVMNDIYSPAELQVQLGSVEAVDLSEFYDVDVGKCYSDSQTDEQRKLFTTVRTGVGANEVCAYWVRSITSPFVGCASHPPNLPSLIVTRFGTPYVLAHELGHVLGLTHVADTDRRNLMRNVDQYDDPPPDIDARQVRIMRSSRWTRKA